MNPSRGVPGLLILLSLWLIIPQSAQCYYNPSTGRWLTRDPIGEMREPNLYAFVASPVSVIDIIGLCGKCCECAVGIDISFWRNAPYPLGGNPGTDFSVTIYLEYHPAEKEGRAKYKWEEKSNRPSRPSIRRGARPNEWFDQFENDPATIPDGWKKRLTSCDPPVGRIVEDSDWPSANPSLGRRVLHFRISVENPKGCGCGPDPVVTAVQIVESNGDVSFQTPDPGTD